MFWGVGTNVCQVAHKRIIEINLKPPCSCQSDLNLSCKARYWQLTYVDLNCKNYNGEFDPSDSCEMGLRIQEKYNCMRGDVSTHEVALEYPWLKQV